MAFKLGSLDTATMDGVTATLKAWPSPVLKPEAVELLDGAFYARTGTAPLSFTFDVLLSAATTSGVHAARDHLLSGLDVTAGLQALTPETGEGWVWWAAPAQISEFKRGLWVNGLECQLRGEVEFLVPDGVGWATPDETATSTTSSLTITRVKGNLPSRPRITIAGVYDSVSVQVGAATVNVDIALRAGQTLVLDYQEMDFAVWQGTTKIRHAASGMSTFERLALPIGHPVTITASATGGAVSQLTVAANSRRS